MTNPFDEAIKKINAKPVREPKKQTERDIACFDQILDNRGVPIDSVIICDGDNIHTADGIPLFDQQAVRGIKNELLHEEEH